MKSLLDDDFNNKKTLCKLTYLSILDGLRHTYMNIGFDSPGAAQRELDLLKRDYDKKWKEYTDDYIRQMYMDGIQMYISMIGRDYKIEPIKLRAL